MHLLLLFFLIYFSIGFLIILIDYLLMNNIILSILFLWPLWVLGFFGYAFFDDEEDLDENDDQ